MTERLKEKSHIITAWLQAGLCILGIFLIAPIARLIQDFVSTRWDRAVFGYGVIAVVVIGFFLLISVLYFQMKIRSLRQYGWLALIFGAYVIFTLSLWDSPEEAVHFIYFGLLTFFLLRALRYHIQDDSIYLTAFFIGSLVGILDEIIQWMLPDRFWDIRDIGLNSLACLLFLVAVKTGIRPKFIKSKITPRTFRIASVLFMANLVLFGLCFSNTPQRVQRYTQTFPFLSFLEKEEAMSEFKYKHKDPEIGIFFSRLQLEEIEFIDKEKGFGNARILNEWKSKPYKDYLRTFPGHVHPFLYEIRVHIFRRDRMMSRAKEANEPGIKENFLFVALMENRLLEKYYGLSLSLSSYAWSQQKKEETAAAVDIEDEYRSPVAAGVFAGVREITMWLVIASLVAMLFGLNIWFSRK